MGISVASMGTHRTVVGTTVVAAAMLFLVSSVSSAAIVPGGGGKSSTCLVVFDAPQANHPQPPRAPKGIKCTDGDLSCDTDGERNGECVFEVAVCLNSTDVIGCVAQQTDSVTVAHADDNANDSKFDVDFQALQARIDLFDFPGETLQDACTSTSTVTVRMKGPKPNNKMGKGKKKLDVTAFGVAAGKLSKDKSKLKMICAPEGDRIYLPMDLYAGTFDRIRSQVFAQSCAVAECHDSEANAGGLVLLPGAAHSNLVDAAPTNGTANTDGLLRVDGTGDPQNSFLYRKITGDLVSGYGERMPLVGKNLGSDLTELIRLWIVGDVTNGPAPATGWVPGTED